MWYQAHQCLEPTDTSLFFEGIGHWGGWVGGWGGRARWPLRQIEIPRRVAEIGLGTAVFRSPQLRRTFLRFTRFRLLCDTGRCEWSLQRDVNGSWGMLVWAILLFLTLLFRSVVLWQLVLSPICAVARGIFWWPIWGRPSLPEYEISHGGCLFFAIEIEVFLKVALYIASSRFVDTLSPSEVFIFPSGFAGTFVTSLQFSSWMLWGLV